MGHQLIYPQGVSCNFPHSTESGIDRRVALIADITGRDRSHLSDFLPEYACAVHGIVRGAALQALKHHHL
jgi:hypothetical protein